MKAIPKGLPFRQLATSLVIFLSLVAFPVYSQEQNGCFMLDEKGKRINLGSLCGDSTGTPASSGTSGTSGNPAPTVSTPGVFKTPIKKRLGGIPVIDVIFNNQYTFEMLVDTGASATIITPAMAESLKLQNEGTATMATAGGVVPLPLSRVKSVEIAGARVENVIVGISSMLPLGLLGQNFFSEYDVIIRKDVVEFHHR